MPVHHKTSMYSNHDIMSVPYSYTMGLILPRRGDKQCAFFSFFFSFFFSPFKKILLTDVILITHLSYKCWWWASCHHCIWLVQDCRLIWLKCFSFWCITLTHHTPALFPLRCVLFLVQRYIYIYVILPWLIFMRMSTTNPPPLQQVPEL